MIGLVFPPSRQRRKRSKQFFKRWEPRRGVTLWLICSRNFQKGILSLRIWLMGLLSWIRLTSLQGILMLIHLVPQEGDILPMRRGG